VRASTTYFPGFVEAGIVTARLNEPLFSPVEFVLALVTSLLPGLQAAQPAIVMVTCCGGTQLCPLMVMVPPARTLLDEISITGGLDASTVNGPSSWLLATLPSVIRVLQMLYCSLTCPAEAGHAKA
jgi:hypothetical protein